MNEKTSIFNYYLLPIIIFSCGMILMAIIGNQFNQKTIIQEEAQNAHAQETTLPNGFNTPSGANAVAIGTWERSYSNVLLPPGAFQPAMDAVKLRRDKIVEERLIFCKELTGLNIFDIFLEYE